MAPVLDVMNVYTTIYIHAHTHIQVAYCKTLRDLMVPVLDVIPRQYVSGVTDKQAMLALWAIALLPLSLIKSLSSLRYSIMCMVCV